MSQHQQKIVNLLSNFTLDAQKIWSQVIENIIQIRRFNEALRKMGELTVVIAPDEQQKITNEKQRLQQVTIDLLKSLVS